MNKCYLKLSKVGKTWKSSSNKIRISVASLQKWRRSLSSHGPCRSVKTTADMKQDGGYSSGRQAGRPARASSNTATRWRVLRPPDVVAIGSYCGKGVSNDANFRFEATLMLVDGLRALRSATVYVFRQQDVKLEAPPDRTGVI